MADPIKKSDNPGPRWWEVSGFLSASLLRLDGHAGAVVNAEKQVVDPVVIAGSVTRQLPWIAQRTDLGGGEGVVEQPCGPFALEAVKPAFTREPGSFRRHLPSRGVRDPIE
jgi:hypothetical protein